MNKESKIFLGGEGIVITNFPMPPSANQLYQNVTFKGGGRRGRSRTPKYNEYIREVNTWAARIDKSDLRYAREKIKKLLKEHKTLQVDLVYRMTKFRCYTAKGEIKKKDTFNYIKALHDKLSDILMVDDSYFWDGNIRREVSLNDMEGVDIRIRGRKNYTIPPK